MTTTDEDDFASSAKAELLEYLQRAREDLLWKLEGLSEHDVRRPLVPSGTNLLGLVKHTAGTEAGYLGDTFGRPFPEPLPWAGDDADDNADMWATPEESRADLVELYRRVWAHSDATVAALPLDAVGLVPWWPPERREPSLHRVLTHVIAETSRHAGHADVVRELIDGAAGMRAAVSNLPDHDADWWIAHHDQLERAARLTGS
ncbi:MAG TPA: DinB family protein [Friedmanniella sp.]